LIEKPGSQSFCWISIADADGGVELMSQSSQRSGVLRQCLEVSDVIALLPSTPIAK